MLEHLGYHRQPIRQQILEHFRDHRHPLREQIIEQFRQLGYPIYEQQPPTSDPSDVSNAGRAANHNETLAADHYDTNIDDTYEMPILEGDLLLGLLKCGHVYHFDCIWKWMGTHTRCPICRSYIRMSAMDIKAVTFSALFTGKGCKMIPQSAESRGSNPDVHSIAANSSKHDIFTVEGEIRK